MMIQILKYDDSNIEISSGMIIIIDNNIIKDPEYVLEL